jgi:hypothetical protein
MHESKHALATIIICLAISLPANHVKGGYDRTFDPGSLIIPMDLSYQDHGVFQAYGLIYQLLRQGIKVYWVIDPDKHWHTNVGDQPLACDTAQNECAWDCAEEGSGIKCPYPTASPDFFASSQVVWDGDGNLNPGDPINLHGYRGGPFLIDAADRDAALTIINAWNDPALWTGNPWAQRTVFNVVSVHEVTSAFSGYVRKEMIAAPTIAVFGDGTETVATGYLRAAGIPQSNGDEFPTQICGDIPCGPATANPDMLTVASVAGDMGTCENPNMDHRNGALFTADGLPAYCQIMSMHWDSGDRESVLCDDGPCPASQADCNGETITYHGHEVVAEVRQFLNYRVHLFAECQAVNSYENTVPVPHWPYLDDIDREGHFLTDTGYPPDCFDPGSTCNGKDWLCYEDFCDFGTRTCCNPKSVKELGAGLMVASKPAQGTIKVYRPEIPYNQFDGEFGVVGGSEPAYNLSNFLGSGYKNDRDVTFITGPNGPGDQDIWMTGYMDGICEIGCDDDNSTDCDVSFSECHTGKVSYLGGHEYLTAVPLSTNSGSQGTRLFLNALFEADCVTATGQPNIDLGLGGSTRIRTTSFPVERTYWAQYNNLGEGIALDSVLGLAMPAEITLLSYQDVGSPVTDGVDWDIGSIGPRSGQPEDPPPDGERWATVSFSQPGLYQLEVRMRYRVGISEIEIEPFSMTVDVSCNDFVSCTDDGFLDGNCSFVANDANCTDDALFCNGTPICDPASGCIPGNSPCPQIECNFCNEQDDSCFDPAGTACTSDELFCNGTESCDGAGSCISSGDPCPEGTFCNEANDQCDQCQQDLDCDDGVACTDDACLDGSCQSTANPALCADDGVHCNGAEFCDPLADCLSTGDPCQSPLYCHEDSQACVACLDNAHCDDGVGCTIDECQSLTCVNSADDSACTNDGLFCSGDEFCDPLLGCSSTGDPCLASGQVCDETSDSCGDCLVDSDCDDGLDCTEDLCQAGSCSHSPDDTLCADDALFCTGTESCDLFVGCLSTGDPCPAQGLYCNESDDRCDACTLDQHCDDQIGCTLDQCLDGACTALADDNACADDGVFCNGIEQCDSQLDCVSAGDPCLDQGLHCNEDAMICQSCTEDDHCDDQLACTSDSCLEGECQHSLNHDLCADDGNFCNGIEICDPVSGCTSSGDPCLLEGLYCNQDQSRCDQCQEDGHCDDNVACTQNTCVEGACLFVVDPSLCADDGLFCNGTEFCDPALGCSSNGDPCLAQNQVCDEANDSCTGCGSNDECDDGIDCTEDLCQSGFCTHQAHDVFCADNGFYCDGSEACDPTLGCISSGDPCQALSLVCDEDQDACGQCFADADCDDGVACTDDTCANDVCVYTANDALCPGDGQFCNGLESCDPAQGCVSGTPPCGQDQYCNENTDNCLDCVVDGDCDDAIPCTQDSCNAGTCIHNPDHLLCNDGLFCSGSESCVPPLGCVSAGNPCGDQVCSETSGVCLACQLDSDCDDQVACTQDLCLDGACQYQAEDANCPDDGNFCNGVESCDLERGCISAGDPCTALDQVCDPDSAQCRDCLDHAECDDGIACTEDSCLAGQCSHLANDLLCADDGLFCTGPLVCQTQDGCVPSQDPCQASGMVCNEINDLCQNCIADADCNDGSPCTQDNCDNGTCQHQDNPLACNDDGRLCVKWRPLH